MDLTALLLSCTLKPSPAISNTEALAEVVLSRLGDLGVPSSSVRVVDHHVPPGVASEALDADDAWPDLHRRLLDADILVLASPTWVGRPSSVAQRVLERMDGMIAETDDEGRPVAFGKVAGVVVTGNEDGAHHVISELSGGLVDIGYTIPGQAWTYWNMGPGPGSDYLDTDEGHGWAGTTGRTCAQNLHAAATALRAHPLPVPAQG